MDVWPEWYVTKTRSQVFTDQYTLRLLGATRLHSALQRCQLNVVPRCRLATEFHLTISLVSRSATLVSTPYSAAFHTRAFFLYVPALTPERAYVWRSVSLPVELVLAFRTALVLP
ncbi:hypothetical protein NDU88_001961 [Pleurodeles waltl]|uniref:Uncharacterized protein n=1 Tax=Pleurodeles waltl TaxID=8319 RepID=A0AAV7W1U9_PLEWA|nr:hypothetical protein NDU88_001961 [Pleurodeles waltl]